MSLHAAIRVKRCLGTAYDMRLKHAARKRVQCGPPTSRKIDIFKEIFDLFSQFGLKIQRFLFSFFSKKKSYFKSHATRESVWVWDPCHTTIIIIIIELNLRKKDAGLPNKLNGPFVWDPWSKLKRFFSFWRWKSKNLAFFPKIISSFLI